ncbi:immunoglobulin-like domain-containing protein [Bacillus mesophilum]|uniref:Bacterial Ig-like domain-containing protein n=1 Tax=Bacillus mesophilum TaxID=1071718 RepID=A0A7V7UXH2_9BACI|nr:immunoglobulin-like domain-containing protein [Bacillus mesophilum]KAB2335604.1 hypothetical protein F7732_03255 [Bacillus mesophilum]
MKRNLISIVPVVMSLILAAGCNDEQKSEEADLEPTPYETVNNFQGVTMKIKEGSVSPTNLTVVFENNSDKQGLYGEGFVLEKKSENQWFGVPSNVDEYSIQDIGYDLEPETVQEWEAVWEILYGSLDEGEYRIVKEIMDFRETGDYDEYYLTAEFMID